MIGQWTAFAHTGDPHRAGQPPWRATTPARLVVQGLAPDRIGPVDFAGEHRYAFWSR